MRETELPIPLISEQAANLVDPGNPAWCRVAGLESRDQDT